MGGERSITTANDYLEVGGQASEQVGTNRFVFLEVTNNSKYANVNIGSRGWLIERSLPDPCSWKRVRGDKVNQWRHPFFYFSSSSIRVVHREDQPWIF